MEEIWKVIDEAPNYEVSNLGRVRNIKKNKIMKPFMNNSGYYQVVLRGKEKTSLYRLVHRLVALNFIDNPNNYFEVNHKDFDKTNNKVDNLEWVSHHINMKYNSLNSTSLDKLSALIIKECGNIIKENLKKYVIEVADYADN